VMAGCALQESCRDEACASSGFRGHRTCCNRHVGCSCCFQHRSQDRGCAVWPAVPLLCHGSGWDSPCMRRSESVITA